MTQYPEILVLRHGQTEWNREGRHQGQRDSPLTDHGLQQARDQGTILAALDADWTGFDAFFSPQLRAARTAELALGAINKTGRADDRLKEVAFGAWEGRTPDEIERVQPGFEKARDDDPFGVHFHSPGGENFAQMAARCQSFLSDLQRPTVIVCHGITSRVLRGLWLGTDSDGMSDLPGGQGCVFRLNDAGHTTLTL